MALIGNRYYVTFDEALLRRTGSYVRIAIRKVLTTRLCSLPGVTVVEEPPAPTEALPGARADLKVEVNTFIVDEFGGEVDHSTRVRTVRE